MKTPKRVPWASQAELTELYGMLFSPAADLESRRRGLARVSVLGISRLPSLPSRTKQVH